MSNAVATVAFLQGQAWAKAPDGSLRALTVGSVLHDDEVLVTAEGAQVQLDTGSGDPIQVNGGVEVAMSRDFTHSTATDPNEAALDDASVQEALTVLEQGGDLLEELEETAAGNNAGGGSDGNNGFVQLTRILEETDSQSFNYQSATPETIEDDEFTDGAPINAAPSVTDQSLVGNEDEVIGGRIIATDIEGDNLTYTLATGPVNGVLTLSATSGQFMFTPNANFNGGDSFVVTVTDSRGNSTSTTVNLTVVAVNDAPTASNISLSTNEDSPVNGQVIAQDIEADLLAYSVTTNPANGTVTLNPATGAFIYTPNANYNGSDSFIVTVNDGKGGTTTSTVSIGVLPVNDVPVAGNDTAVVSENSSVVVAVRSNDTDPDGNPLTVTAVTQGTNGSVVIDAITGNPIYTPNAGFNGSDSFTYTISDNNGGTSTATVNVTVTPVNDVPVANDDSVTVNEDDSVTITVRGNDTDADGNPLTVTAVTQGTNGSVVIDAITGNPIYTPNAGFNGSDSFTYTISDGNGGTSTATVNVIVTPVNDAPVANDDSVTVNEDDSVTIAVRGNDTDVDGNPLTVTAVTQGTNGSVVIDAITGNPIYTPNAGFNGSDSFTYTVSDGNGGTSTATVNVIVTPVNDAPVANDDSVTVNEDDSVTIAVRGNDTDVDGNPLTVTAVTQGTNGSVVIDAITGNPIYTPNAGFNGSDSFTYTISDNNGGTATATVNVTVTPVNDVPVANDDSVTVNEDDSVVVAVRGNDTDADGNPLTVTAVTQGTNGSVVIDAITGNPIYTPNAGFNGSDSFTYTVSDGNGGTSTATVNVTVTPVNDAPVANDDSVTVNEDDSVVVAVRGNDTDADGNPLTVTAVTQGTNGSVVIDAITGNPIYTPNAGFNGSDSFTYTISDGNGGTSTATVNVTVTPVNDVPVANDDRVTVNEDGSVTIAVRSNDTDADGNPLTVTAVTQGANGSVVIDAITGNPIYTPNAGFNGSDSFTYTISDNNGGTATATVNVTVTPVNDAPVANDDSVTVNEDDSVVVAVRGNDTDADGNPLTVTAVTQGANGSVVIDAITGNPIYTPNAGFNGSDSFTYTISDNNGGTSTATVNVTVTPVNDAPVANDDSVTVNEDDSVTIAVRSNDTDADGNPLTVTGVTQGTNGSVVIDAITGNPIYTPNAGFNGSDSFTYTISDNNGGTSTATVNVTVTAVNDAPVANDDSVTVNEDDSVVVAVRGNDTDADGNPLTVTAVTQGTNGSVVIDAITGNPIYTPNAGFNGSDSFTYTVSDGNGGTSTATVNVTVTPVNDVPVANDDSVTVNEDGSVTIAVRSNDTDADGNPLTVTAVTQGANGSVVIDAVTGNPIYTPNAGFNGSDSFTYTISDNNGGTSTATVNVTVTPVNDAPVANDDSVTVNEDGSVTIAVRSNDTDADGNPLTVTAVTQGANGSVVIDAVTGNPIYTPNAGFNGSDSFTYTISDGNGGTSTATVNVTVTPVNDAPVANDDSVTVDEDDSVTIAVRGNDTDADGNPLTVTAVTQGTNGSVVIDAITGNPIYSPNAGFNGSDSFTYTISDGNGGTSTATVNVTVTPVNDAPVANDDSVTVNEDDSVVVAVRGNDTDADGNPLTVTAVTQGTNGSVVIDAITGNPIYTPNAGFNGSDSFTYTISDGNGGTSTATVNVTVTPVNDAPVANDDSVTVNEDDSVTIAVRGNDTDADGNPLTVTAVTQGANGSVVIDAITGNPIYSPNAGFNGSDSFTYTISDNNGGTATATVNVTVTPVNDAPVAVVDTINVIEGGTSSSLASGATSVLANDSDPENDTLSAILVTGPQHGSLTLNTDGTFTYVHNGSETTADSFQYRANDGTANSNIVTVNIVIAPQNDAPQTNAAIASGNEDTLIPLTLSGSDVDGTVTGFVIKSLPANGVLYSDISMTSPIALGDVVSGSIYFMPNANWNGNTNFTFAARDNGGLEDPTPATASITVNPMPDAAVLGTGTGSVKEDTPAQSSASGILTINDPDAGQAVFIAQTNVAGTYGSFSVNASGAWAYNLDNTKPGVQSLKEGEIRSEVFNVQSQDGTSTTVTITVTGTNDLPVANADTASMTQGGVLTLTPAQLLGNDTDLDADALTLASVGNASSGTVSIVGGNVQFTPAPGFSGPASFTYIVSDGHGTATGTVSVTVLPNATPDAVNDPSGAVPYSVAFGDLSATDNWTNLDSKGLTVNIAAYGATGVAGQLYQGSVDGNNNVLGVLGTPRGYSDAPNQIEYNIGTGQSESIVMTFNGNLNQASFGVSRLFPGENGGEIGLWQAYYNGVLVASNTFRLLGAVDAGTFTIDTGSTVFNSIKFSALHTNNSTGDGGDYFLTSFAGSGPASVNSSLKVTAGASNTINAAVLLANDTDADNDTLSIASVQGAVNGTVTLVGGNAVFTPTTGYTGPASFTYTVSDGRGGFDTATVNLIVERTNTAPNVANDSAATAPNTAITIATSTLLANDSDAQGDAFTLTSVQGAVNGSVSLVGPNVVFTPISNYEGPASFTYTVRDALGATSTATVNIGVGAASAPSVVVSKALVVNAHGTGGASIKFPITTELVDTDGSETLSIRISGVPTNLSFNAGTNLGGGVWQFTEADLPNLTLNVPGSYTTNSTSLTVQVISTETNGGFTASTSTVVTLKAAYTTVDVTTTDPGSYTGSSASEFIQGGTGNNTINASTGNNIVYGGAGNDNLSAGSGSDVIFGESGNDSINAGSGSDRISGGSGNDTLQGGDAGESFVDVFVWTLGDQGAAGTPAVDTINNFATAAAGNNTSGGDVLDLRDLLQGESVGASNSAGNLANYLHFEVSGGSTIIHVSHTGGFGADSHSVGGSYTSSAETQQIVLNGVNLQTLYSGATTDQQIITQLLNNNKLITD